MESDSTESECSLGKSECPGNNTNRCKIKHQLVNPMKLSNILPLLLASILIGCASPITPTASPTLAFTFTPPPTPTQGSACITIIETEPTPGPDEPSLFPPVSADEHVRGAEDTALVTFVEYGDFQDSPSAAAADSLALLVENYPDTIRVVFRPYPLIHNFDKSALAAQAAEAAGEQGFFWEMHDLLFTHQAEWTSLSEAEFVDWLDQDVEDLGLDVRRFASDLQSEEIETRVQEYWESAQSAGLPWVPIMLINGQIYSGPRSYPEMERIVNLIALGERQFECPPFEIDPGKQYIATLHTEKGDIVLQLFADKAPLAVNSFVFLARHGWYDGITFHRVIEGFVAQSGDPSGSGAGNPGYFFANEVDPSLEFDQAGVLAMANSGPDTNGSQFFITYGAVPHLNGQYTIFGKVLTGMDVLEKLTPRNPQPGVTLPPGDKLISVTIKEN